MAEEEASEQPVEAEEEPKKFEIKVEVTTAKKWWNDKAVDEEGNETVVPNESLATTSCSVALLGLHNAESEACSLDEDSQQFKYGLSATFSVEEKDLGNLPSKILNQGLILSIYDASKEVVGTAEVDLVNLLEKDSTLVEGTASLGLVKTTEEGSDKGIELSYSLSVSEPLQTKEGGLIGRVMGLTLSPVPESLQKAIEDSGVSPDFVVGIQVPLKVGGEKELLEFRNGLIKDSSVTWAKAMRFYVQPDDVAGIKKQVKKESFSIEVARYMPPSSELGDPNSSAYYFYSDYSLGSLLAPDAQIAALGCKPVTPVAEVATGDEEGSGKAELKLGLLSKPEYAEKASPFPEETGLDEGINAWATAGSSLSFEVKLDYPLLKSWSLPSDTIGKLSEFISVKQVEPKLSDKMAVKQKAFVTRCKNVAKILIRDYGDAFEEDGGSGTQKNVIFHLNKSGAYMKMKEFLKKSAIEIIEQRIGSSTVIKQMDSHALLNEAYSILLGCVQDALKEMQTKNEEGEDKDDKSVLQKMKMLADEYELNENLDIAERYHVDRISNSKTLSPNLWYDYGHFCLRSNMADKAEECFREELSSYPNSVDTLLALSGLLLGQSKTPKGNKYLLDQAEVFIHTALRQDSEDTPESMLMWAMLALLYSKTKGLDSDPCQNCIFKATREKKTIKVGLSELEVDGLTHLVFRLLDLSLPQVALDALSICSSIPEVDKLLCTIQIHYLLKEYSDAFEVLTQVLKFCEPDDVRPYVLAGKIHCKTENYEGAIASFTHVMSINANACTLDILLKYGKALMSVGTNASIKTALDVFVFACQKCPCASTWLGCAVACIELEDFSNAETALTEASILDTKNAKVWAYSCILSLKLGRKEVAESALEFVLLENLVEVDLLNAMAKEFASFSMHRQAVQVLRKSLSVTASRETLKLLGDSLFMLGSKLEAKKFYDDLLSQHQSDIGVEEAELLQQQVENISLEFGLSSSQAITT